MNNRPVSLIARISFGLLLVVALAVVTLIASYWLSERVNEDPEAINVAGSLRMQTYQIGFLVLREEPSSGELEQAFNRIEQSWQHPIFRRYTYSDARSRSLYQDAYSRWQTLRFDIDQQRLDGHALEQAIAAQVNAIDTLVTSIQQSAESKIEQLRVWLIISLIATLLVTVLVMHSLKTRFEKPLIQLGQAAKRISQGDFTARVHVPFDDELGALAKTMNKMSDTIGFMYGRLEQRVQEQTESLQHSHTTLMFLYDIAQKTNEKAVNFDNFEQIIQRLRLLLDVPDIELCLLTEGGSAPYLQFQGDNVQGKCVSLNCDDCVYRGETCAEENGKRIYRFPLRRDAQHFGVLVCRLELDEKLADWQQQLLQSVSDQLALALSVRNEEDQVRRLTLVKERTVIARELHDSLAQALSYLKIQVTRLNKAIEHNNKAVIEDVSKELKQGLDSAYRQLRELLTTFRLKVDGGGFLEALHNTAKQLQNQGSLRVHVESRIENAPLAPHEEIHLLQIIREGCQNAIHHSEGSDVWIRIEQLSEHRILLSIEDNGVGIPDTPEKLNHYGLAIIRERGRHLGGEVNIKKRPEGGTGVYFEFTPMYLKSPVPITEVY
ncbi:ATP-binding protein [Aliidiomarina sanyensis]|uniref:ATP-binding protein n=1 Tax=Aliidiomarina sanyensis TaxID=1249555 RepID=UPI001F542A35|nr:ATP-binding protein [Aliidiomarina sanyensis]